MFGAVIACYATAFPVFMTSIAEIKDMEYRIRQQQMRWHPQTAHLLLQVRTRTLNGTLREIFQRWWPAMAPVSAPALS
jgi:hypothetical protein